jgi:mycothiol synthase
VAGLSYLAGRRVTEAMLYVDESNAAAVALYRKLGFEVFAADVMYAR